MITAVGGLAAVAERISAIENRLAAFRPEPLSVRRPSSDGGTPAGGALPPAAGPALGAALGHPGGPGGLTEAHGVMDIAQRMLDGDFGAVFGAVDQALGTGMPRAVARPGSGVPGLPGAAMWGPAMWGPAMWGPSGPWSTPGPGAVGTYPGGGGLPAGTPFGELFVAAGERHGISPQVLAAVAHVESRFRTDAVSPAGAQGVMQFMPATAASMGVDPWDPPSAIDGAARLLRQFQDRFGSLELALAAYNVGPGTISRAGGIQPGSQGEKYVGLVRRAMEDFA